MIMRRKLYLIISDGGGNTPLRGVHIDKDNFLNFFKSPEGGAWKDDEISVFDKNNFYLEALKINDLTARVNKHPIDFYLIVFCGHGYTDQNHQIFFEVRQDFQLNLDDLLGAVARSRCLVIADSCRAIYHLQEGGRIADVRLFSTSEDARNSAYADLCRNEYNDLIEATPSTMQVVYFSNSDNETANENPRVGGFYSHELLATAKEQIEKIKTLQQHDNQSYYVSIDDVHSEAASIVASKTHNGQHPDIYLNCRSKARFPFVVVPHWQLQLLDD